MSNPKAKAPAATKPEAKAKAAINWEAVRIEWDLGQLDVREIARQYGCDHSAIVKRASRKGWPARPPKVACVTGLVTKMTREDKEATLVTPRVAVTAFERVIKLLHRHRALMGRLDDEIALCLQDVTDARAKIHANGGTLRLDQVDTVMSIVAKAAQALGKLVPLERRAFGLVDTEGPSEFDALSEDDLKAVEDQINRALS